MLTALLWLAAGVALGWWLRNGPRLEHREAVVRWRQKDADAKLREAQAVREQWDGYRAEAEHNLRLIRAATEDTQVLPTIRVRVDGALKSLKDYAHHVFGDDGHEGWTEESWAAAQQELVSRRDWPLRHRPTPLDMPDPLEPTDELLIRIHHREGLATTP